MGGENNKTDAVSADDSGNPSAENEATGASPPSSSPQHRHQVYIRNLGFTVNRDDLLRNIEASGKVDMSSVLEVRIARSGRLHDRPLTGKGSTGERMCSAFVIFSDYEAAKLMRDYWHDSRWQELGGYDLVCKVEALQERGRGPPQQRPVVQEEPHQSQQCPFAPPAQQHAPQHSGYYYPETMPLPVPPPPPGPPPFMMGQQFHHGMVHQQRPQVVMMPQPQQYYPGPPPPPLRPPSGGPPLAGAQFIARPQRNAVSSQCQAKNASVVGPDGRKDEEKDGRMNDGNHKVDNKQEEQKEELPPPHKPEQIIEQPEKEDVKESTPPLLEVKEEYTSSPTIRGVEDLDDDDDDKQVEQKWRQSAEGSEENDDEEMQKRLKDALHDRVATDDPYIEIDGKDPITPWKRRMDKRLSRQEKATGDEKEPSLPPLEHPELEVKMESDDNEARSRGTHGCKKNVCEGNTTLNTRSTSTLVQPCTILSTTVGNSQTLHPHFVRRIAAKKQKLKAVVAMIPRLRNVLPRRASGGAAYGAELSC